MAHRPPPGGGGSSAEELARPCFVFALHLFADLIRKNQNVLSRELNQIEEDGTLSDRQKISSCVT